MRDRNIDQVKLYHAILVNASGTSQLLVSVGSTVWEGRSTEDKKKIHSVTSFTSIMSNTRRVHKYVAKAIEGARGVAG